MNSYLLSVPVLAVALVSLSGLVLFAVGDTAPTAADAVASALNREELVQGGVTARFDAEVERTHPLRAAALPLVATARYLFLRQGNSGVVVGREGWLFTNEEFQHHAQDEQRLQRRLQYIERVAEVLERRRGISLVVVVVPSKARVAAEYAPAYLESLVVHRRLPRAVAALREAQITVVNAAETLRPDDFFRRDTHWRPGGARRVAERVRQAVAESDDWNGGGEFPGFGTSHRLFRGERRSLQGDLLSFVPVGVWREALGLTAEDYRPLVAEPIGADSGGAGLFDTPEIPLVLVGTSYSADERFGFESALRGALEGDLLNLAEPAGGPFQPMEAFLQGDTISEIPPRIVIWEVPERYLTLPDTDAPGDPESVALDGRPW